MATQRNRMPDLQQVPDLHAIAKSVCTEDLDDAGPYFFCGILKHDKSPFNRDVEPTDFIWVKCKGNHTVGKITRAYPAVEADKISFKLDDKYPDPASSIQSLDSRRDRVVVFHAVSQDNPNTFRSHTMDRQPLQPVTSQPIPKPYDGMAKVKPEPGTNDMPLGENMMGGSPYTSPYTPGGVPSPIPADGYLNFKASMMRRAGPDLTLTDPVLRKHWDTMSASQRAVYNNAAASTSTAKFPTAPKPYGSNGGSPSHYHGAVKREVKYEDRFSMADEANDNSFDGSFDDAEDNPMPKASKPAEKSRLQKLLHTASPEVLESEVQKGMELLGKLHKPLSEQKEQSEDANQWLQQIEALQKQVITTPTVIGVVGNTGAGKSSVINAMLDEERLVPTNCMRACTAVVTEMSWNSSDDEDKKYRAAIEFIQPEDWEKELKLLFEELLDGAGNVSRECANPETEAGVAYAKIKAVYPLLTKEEMASSSVDQLMRVAVVRDVLGTTKNVSNKHPDIFYRRLQNYVDSKEKNGGKKEKGPPSIEYWPLIKVVKIYTKADALSTGAIIVDLPGVQDSNAARAAVANNYIKNCSGLWIVSPISRAVDDKAAKTLLGESFKRQLKYDGTYSRVTFICSKTDDISLTEATDGLGLQEDMGSLFEESDKLSKQEKELKTKIKDFTDTKAVLNEVYEDAETILEQWEAIQEEFEKGETVYAPRAKSSKNSKKRKHKSPQKQRKKRKNDSDDSDEDAFQSAASAQESEEEESDAEDQVDEEREALTEKDIESKIDELKATKKKARQERASFDGQIKDIRKEIAEVKSKSNDIDAQMNALCISGRNKYSKTAIQQDFASGIKELDQENMMEEDEENFNPDEDIRDYEEVARSLPVFCVSARGYQSVCGRFKRDGKVTGFKTTEETEIPQLQAHCKRLTEKSRSSNCRRFLNSLSQLTNSMCLWASNDGTGLNLTDEQKDAEARNLKKKLDRLEKGFEKNVDDCIKDLKEALEENIYEKYQSVIPVAADNAPLRFSHWTSPVNRMNRPAGGYHFMTWRAIVRRNGVYSNAQGPHDLNAELCEPIMRSLATGWEKVFSRRLPAILKDFSRASKSLLNKFHVEIEKRCLERGVGIAGMNMLKQQLLTYETAFNELAQAIHEVATEHSREANRGFQPVIEHEMQPSFEYCAGESGTGCYMRMKAQMRGHIEQIKTTMFVHSTDSVKNLLKSMVSALEAQLADGADEAFVRIRRDYMQVVGGVKLPQGQKMSKAEKSMRAEVCKLLDDNEKDEQDEVDNEGHEAAASRIKSDVARENEAANNEAPAEDNEDNEDGNKDIADSEEVSEDDENSGGDVGKMDVDGDSSGEGSSDGSD